MGPFDPRLPIIATQARVRPPHVYFVWQAMKVQGKAFHAEACALFAGLETRHVLAIIAALTDHDALPDGRAKVERRAARLPDDWVCPDEWIEWASGERFWSPVEASAEAEVFANYWQSKSGQQATKLDWFKTFKNWVRNSRRPNGTYRPVTIAKDRDPAWLEEQARFNERIGRDDEAAVYRAKLAEVSNVIPMRREA